MNHLNCLLVVVWLAVFTFFTLPCTCPAASAPYTLHRFISTALSDPAVTVFKGIQGIAKVPGDTPYIERVELRAGVESSDDDSQQDYRLRFFPRPWGETQKKQQLLEIQQKAYEAEQQFYLGQALKERYNVVLKYIWCMQQLKLKRNLEKIYEDRSFVLQKKLTTRSGADVGALIASENKRIELHLNIDELENQLTGIKDTIYRIAKTADQIAFKEDHLISMDLIKKIMAGQTQTAVDRNVELMRQNYEVQMANCEYALEKAKSRDYLRFFEVGHSVDDRDEESISFEIGLRLPFISTYRNAIWERKTDVQREKFSYNKAKINIESRTVRLHHSIELLISQYKILRSGFKKDNAIKAVRSYIAATGRDPLDLLKLNENIVEHDIQLNDTIYSIRSSFIAYLELTGLLTQKPLINYLSNYLTGLI